jgi:hypothetical protein
MRESTFLKFPCDLLHDALSVWAAQRRKVGFMNNELEGT